MKDEESHEDFFKSDVKSSTVEKVLHCIAEEAYQKNHISSEQYVLMMIALGVPVSIRNKKEAEVHKLSLIDSDKDTSH